MLTRCHNLVQEPAPADFSLNVAVAGSLVIAHRYWSAIATEQAVAS